MNLDRVARWWRLAPWSSNSLMRRGDRIVALATVVAVCAVLVLIPIAAVFGSLTYSRLVAESSAMSNHVHQIGAVVVDVPTPMTASTEFAVVMESSATVSWRFLDAEHSDYVRIPANAVQGQKIPIWVDNEGDWSRPPRMGTESAALGVCAAVGIWLLGSLVAACGVGTVRLIAGRASSHQWERELQGIERSV